MRQLLPASEFPRLRLPVTATLGESTRGDALQRDKLEFHIVTLTSRGELAFVAGAEGGESCFGSKRITKGIRFEARHRLPNRD
jgi:hypothetical protein